ncbi:DUF2887 domain-containing protein [Chlorogloeopsis sp. ULAP02]|uniref:DUF2887 domain-containing protein n=1 Tax=Chlorogloeopsis sp. ULAP02 TaxID=3107926 RepID=UPI00313631F5
MKTDSIFYQIFENFPGIFFEFIAQPAVISDIDEFIAVEVKQTAFRIDSLFLPEPGLIEQLIYFLEIQTRTK